MPRTYVQLDRFRRGEELGADRVPRVRTDERQRGEGQADQHGRVLRDAKAPVSPRPEHSALDLSKIKAAGYTPADWEETLEAYVNKELGK